MDSRIQAQIDKYLTTNKHGLEIGIGVRPMVEGAVTTDPNMTTYDGNKIVAHYRNRIEDLRFPNNSFDYVCMGDVLEHLPDPILGLKECQRVLKDKGTLFVLVPNNRNEMDASRRITTLQHCIDDYKTSVTITYNHWQEFVDEYLEPTGQTDRIEDKDRQLWNGWVHFHVWDMAGIEELFRYVFPASEILYLEDNLDIDNDKILIIMEITK